MAVITGGGSAETLAGTGENDTITGGDGGDRLSGGAGIDLFVYDDNDSSPYTAASDITTLDVITDWSAQDRLLFLGGVAIGFGKFHQNTADTYKDAFDKAAAVYGAGTATHSAIQVGSDVYVFAFGAANVAVKLEGVGLGAVQPANFTIGSLAGGITETGSAGNDARTLGPGADRYDGAAGADTVIGGAGADTLGGGEGDDQVFGGLDNDSITDTGGSNYLRGEEGDDVIAGGAGFDDINGNMGRDTLAGGAGTDWVVGGKDDDLAFGEGGDDIVYGNLGNDTLGGGAGDDLVRGGQGDDLVRGDDGRDILAGDRGADTLSGGLGADTFIGFAETGLDRITDFNAGEGDRVQLDPGTRYTLFQEGADTIVDFGFGNRMVLENVQLTALPAGWIYVLG